jgi:glutamine cyclotransferase
MRLGTAVALALTVAASAATIEATFDSPASTITGLAYGQGHLWALDWTTKTVFEMDPATGSVLNSMVISYLPPAYECFGLAISNDTLYVSWLKYGGPDSYYVRHDASTGASLGVVTLC